jgi:hypothetical protein
MARVNGPEQPVGGTTVQVDTIDITALRAEVAALAEAVRGAALRGTFLDAVYERGVRDGQQAAQGTRPRRSGPRPGHLRAVDGGAS